MRFKEFKNLITEAQKGKQADIPSFSEPGYFTVGDSHSNGVGGYGKGKTWKSLGMDGARSDNSMHMSAIERIPPGSVVAISLGANDLAAKTPIPQIVNQVQRVISAAEAKNLQVIYLLPTTTAPNKAKDPKRDELRDALRAAIQVPIVDMGQASASDTMGVHLDSGKYNSIGAQIASQYSPKVGAKTNKLGTPDAVPGAPPTKDRINQSSNLEQGPPYPADQRSEVIKMQKALDELGYNLGRYGADGKYGPFTAAAVAAFKKDYKIEGDGSSFGKSGFDMLSQINSGQVARVKEPTRSNTATGTDFDIPALTSVESVDKARKIAEEFLGRTMNDDEWKHLIQTTTAESSPNQKEMAQIAGVILNRTRSRFNGGRTVVDIVWQPGQFEPVTGHPKKGGGWTGPHPNFTTPVGPQRLAQIIDAYIKYLPGADKSYMNFTSANPAAYKTERGRRFLDTMIAQGGVKLGGTVFGTVA